MGAFLPGAWHPVGPQRTPAEEMLGTETQWPLLSSSPHPPVPLPGFPRWSPESVVRGPGGERVQRAQQSVSRVGRATGGSGTCQAPSGAEWRSPPRPPGSSGLEEEEEEDEDDDDDVPEWQQDEFDEELDNDSFSYDEESENLDRETFFFGEEEEDEEAYD